jgi:hypothetical protein
MKLHKPFCRLPVRFDAERLRYEVEALPPDAWTAHPSGYPGNSAVRLITARGEDNDDVTGEMKPRPVLARLPYLQQVLANFGVVWSRSRLMKLAAHATVPQHCDISYRWYHRVRVHIPIVTFPEVRFYCGDENVHMAAGEAWIFDNWRPHRVENRSAHDRIHLVADTVGGEAFWDFAARGQWQDFGSVAPDAVQLPYRAMPAPPLLTERVNSYVVMPPAEVDAILGSISKDLGAKERNEAAQAAMTAYRTILRGFCSEWRQLYCLFGDTMPGWPHYARLRDALRQRLAAIDVPVYLWSNQVLADTAVQAGVLAHLLNPPGSAEVRETEYEERPGAPRAAPARPAPAGSPIALRVERPVFIVAAPRSGSTLLFETLAQSAELWTLGGEAHGLVEQFDALKPGGGVDSNRLTGAQLTPEIAAGIRQRLAERLRDVDGRRPEAGAAVRMLEKTPKNALRIPFFRALFPDALFIHLWRDPRENLSSIMEAWRAGGWVTYRALDGIAKPWSLLLPPGWRDVRDRPLEEIAAFQWRTTNDIILHDLQAAGGAALTVSYAAFVADPAQEVRRICAFAGLRFDERLRERVSGALPLSRHTQTAPAAAKWQANEAAIQRVLPSLEATWRRLEALAPGPLPADA